MCSVLQSSNQAWTGEGCSQVGKINWKTEWEFGTKYSWVQKLQAELSPETNKEPLQGASLRHQVSRALKYMMESKNLRTRLKLSDNSGYKSKQHTLWSMSLEYCVFWKEWCEEVRLSIKSVVLNIASQVLPSSKSTSKANCDDYKLLTVKLLEQHKNNLLFSFPFTSVPHSDLLLVTSSLPVQSFPTP